MDSFTNVPNIHLNKTEFGYSVLPNVGQLFRRVNRAKQLVKRSPRKEKV